MFFMVQHFSIAKLFCCFVQPTIFGAVICLLNVICVDYCMWFKNFKSFAVAGSLFC